MDEQLGGNIELSGFSGIEAAEMIVVKKLVGKYTQRYTELCKNVTQVKLTLKTVHEKEKGEIFEIKALLIEDGRTHASEVDERNLFFAIDAALKKIENSVSK